MTTATLEYRVYGLPIESKSYDMNDDGTLTIIGVASTTNKDYANEIVSPEVLFAVNVFNANIHNVIPKGTRIFYIERITSESREFEVLFGINKNLKFLKQESEYISHWVLK